MGFVSLLSKETTAIVRERPKLLVEVKAETYYGLRMIEKKFGPVESILMHLQTTPICYVKYRNGEI